jgi:hypothetical protein
MSLLKTAFTSAALLAGGLVASAPDTADAQVRFYIGSGYDGYDRGYDYGHNHRHYSQGYYNDGYIGRGNRVWHDTGHYDYHPTTIRRHRDHYHVTPGHYDYHDTGHWDRGWGGHYHR